ncbi:MAG TPA: hypothetical protein VF813_08040, partial [Anaerolineaceae bacterium]
MSYQKATRAYISLVVLASIALAAAWALRYPAEISPTWPLWFVFIFLIALSLHHPLDHLPADTIPTFAALLLFPPPEFIAVIALGVLAGGKKPGTTTLEFLFHLGRNLLSAAVCAWIFFQFTGGTWSQPNLIVLGGVVAAGASLILINSLLTSGETSIDLHRPFLLQWRRGVETSLGSEALMLSLGLLAAVVVKASPWSVLIIAVSGAAVYRAFQRQAAVGNEQRALVETSARTASNLRAERDRLKESCAELESVAAVIHSLRSAHNRDEIVPMIMDHVCARMQVASGMICLVDPENRKSSVAAARGKWERMTGLRLPPGEGISSKVLAGGMTYVHPDIRIDPDFRTPSRFDGDYSVVGVPMT